MTETHRIVLATATALLTSAAQANPPAVLRICYENQDLMPFFAAVADHGQPGHGLLLELIQSAAQQADLHIEFQRQPWKRCILQLEQGQSDGIFAVIWQADRDSWGQFPGRDAQTNAPVQRSYRLWQVDYPIISRNGGPLAWNGTQFSGLKNGLSAPLGYIANQRLESLGALAKFSYKVEVALKMVAVDRLDGYVLERQTARTYLRKLGLQTQLGFLPEPLLKADWYLPLSHQFYRDHPELAQRFWQALSDQRELRAEELTRRYLAGPD